MRSLEDISPAQIYRANLNSVVFFLLSFVVIYSLNETCISLFQSFQILFFSVSFFSCLVLFLIYLSSLSFFVYQCILYFLFLLLSLSLSVFYFLFCCLLSYSADFLCLSSTFSFCFWLFLCLPSNFFFLLSAFLLLYSPHSSLYLFACVLLLLLLSLFF